MSLRSAGVERRFIFHRLRPLPESWKWGLGVWAAARLALTGWGLLLWGLGPVPFSQGRDFYFGEAPVLEGWRGWLLGVWQRWDAIHYVRLARDGYSQADLSAFFPLYPLLGRALTALTGGDPLAALLLASAVSTLLALVLLFRVVERAGFVDLAPAAVTAVMLFPTGFILFAPYAEGLALALVLFAYDSAFRQRWGLSALAGAGAGLARPTALALALLLLPLAWRSWRTGEGRGSRWLAALAVVAPATGVASFLAWRAWAGFPSWSSVQRIYWSWSTHPPWHTIRLLPQAAAFERLTVAGWLGALVLIVMVFGLVWSFRRLPLGMTLYLAASVLLALTSVRELEPLAHLGRHALLAFPLMVALAAWTATPRRRLAAVAGGAGLHLYFSGQFFLWGWTG